MREIKYQDMVDTFYHWYLDRHVTITILSAACMYSAEKQYDKLEELYILYLLKG